MKPFKLYRIILFSLSFLFHITSISSTELEEIDRTTTEPSLRETIKDFAEFNANLRTKYRAVGRAGDLSGMVKDMVTSLSDIQSRGESMMKNILVQQRKLKNVLQETSKSERYHEALKAQISALEEKRNILIEENTKIEDTYVEKMEQISELSSTKESLEKAVDTTQNKLKKKELEKGEQISRMDRELTEYETKITEASRILNEIELASQSRQEQLEEKEKDSKKKQTLTVDLFAPLMALSVFGNILLAGQAFNLYSFEEIAKTAALSFLPSPRLNEIEDEPMEQMAAIQRRKDENFGAKSEYLRRKHLLYKSRD